jgi:hypothetical protein
MTEDQASDLRNELLLLAKSIFEMYRKGLATTSDVKNAIEAARLATEIV